MTAPAPEADQAIEYNESDIADAQQIINALTGDLNADEMNILASAKASLQIYLTIRKALQALQSSGWQAIDTLEAIVHNRGVMMTGEKVQIHDPAFFLDIGWPVYIRRDLRHPSVGAFKNLGITHWAYLPKPPASEAKS